MNAEIILPYLLAAAGGLLGALCAVLAWVGSQLKNEVGKLADKVETGLGRTNDTLGKIERDLRGELANLDRRVTRVEARCENAPPE